MDFEGVVAVGGVRGETTEEEALWARRLLEEEILAVGFDVEEEEVEASPEGMATMLAVDCDK